MWQLIKIKKTDKETGKYDQDNEKKINQLKQSWKWLILETKGNGKVLFCIPYAQVLNIDTFIINKLESSF